MSSLLRRVDQHMQPLELTGMQWEPVLMLWLKRADTVAGLARVSQVGFASMSRMLDRLEEKKLLRRERSAEDRRVVHLHLTAKGRRSRQRSGLSSSTGMNVHLDGFRKDELARLNEFLGRMLANGVRDAEAPETSVRAGIAVAAATLLLAACGGAKPPRRPARSQRRDAQRAPRRDHGPASRPDHRLSRRRSAPARSRAS
jgi:DNA-binding MarR family transcriptional regulator